MQIEVGGHLSDGTVEVGADRALNVDGAPADVVDGLVIEHDGEVGVREERVGGEHDDSGSDLRRRVDGGEAELGLVAVVDRGALEKKSAEARASAAANSVEDHETWR